MTLFVADQAGEKLGGDFGVAPSFLNRVLVSGLEFLRGGVGGVKTCDSESSEYRA